MSEKPTVELLSKASAKLLNLGVNLRGVCDERVVRIYQISLSGVYPISFLEALARIDEKAHQELGPESYASTWVTN